jgi:cysteine synthase
MKYINDIRELIGNTPLLKLNNISVKNEVNIFAKLESYNPAGSVKDRIGLYMIKRAEEMGLLREGSTIVEATAGNTGLGIAIAAINKGYRVIFVVPKKFSIEKQVLMRALGAEIVSTPRELGMKGAIDAAEELLKKIDGAVSLKQFENPANPQAHYETTGPEIYEALDGNIDYFIAGAGSGGTFTGVMQFLKERIPDVKGIIADPIGSTMGGGKEGCYDIEGIGNNFIPETLNMEFVYKFIKVGDEEALKMVKELARKEGLIVGSSSGATVSAAVKLSQSIDRGNIVVVLPDRGDRYFSKNIYDNITF